VLPGFNLLQHEQLTHWESGKFWGDLNQSDHGDGISYPTETAGGASSPMQTTSFLCISYGSGKRAVPYVPEIESQKYIAY